MTDKEPGGTRTAALGSVGPALVVIPTYNEVSNIASAVAGARRASGAEVLVVDDASPDGTGPAVVRLAADDPGVHLLARPAKEGLGPAYLAGFAWGLARGFGVLVEMDADGSHDPAVLPDLLAAIDAGADLAIGSRYVPGGSTPDWRWHRRALSSWGNRYVRAVLGIGVHDVTAGFRAYRAELLRSIDRGSVRSQGYGFQVEMTRAALRSGATVVEVPIRFVDRRVGSSKMSGTIVAEALLGATWWGVLDALERRRSRPSGDEPRVGAVARPSPTAGASAGSDTDAR
jgi:dolichol-phosphate mannosyltransferase